MSITLTFKVLVTRGPGAALSLVPVVSMPTRAV